MGTRPSCCRSCLAFLLKFLNFLQTFVGVSIVIYSVWMLNHWDRHGSGLGEIARLPAPWFVYTFMGVGLLLSLIAFIGCIAAETINGCCLCFHALLTTVQMLLEAALVVYIAFDKHWEEDLPNEPTGELERLRLFIEANMDICKWVGVTVVITQALSLLLALVIRAMVSPRKRNCDRDEEIAIIRQPLLYPKYVSTSVSTPIERKEINSDVWGSQKNG